MRIVRLPQFFRWFGGLDAKGKAQVDARILRIEDQRHFGDAKDLGDGLAELRWKMDVVYISPGVATKPDKW